MTTYVSTDVYPLNLLALCIWRESRGEVVAAQRAVAWSIRNRVENPTWWGNDWVSVILKNYQYSSFNHNDPNAVKFPIETDTSWQSCFAWAEEAYLGANPSDDPSLGATHYYDRSLDANPPSWAKDGSMVETTSIGNLRFWKVA